MLPSELREGLTFDDVLLVPAASGAPSRFSRRPHAAV